jgi:hypothetical protein
MVGNPTNGGFAAVSRFVPQQFREPPSVISLATDAPSTTGKVAF